MKVHRNLLWLRGEPALLDQVFADRGTAKLLVARPTPDLCAVRVAARQQLLSRLERLGQVPEVVEAGRP